MSLKQVVFPFWSNSGLVQGCMVRFQLLKRDHQKAQFNPQSRICNYYTQKMFHSKFWLKRNLEALQKVFKAIKLYEEKLRNFSKTAIKIHTGVWGNIIKKVRNRNRTLIFCIQISCREYTDHSKLCNLGKFRASLNIKLVRIIVFLRYFHPQVENLLKALNPKKAPCLDTFHPTILKNTAQAISHPFTKIFQINFESSELPTKWLQA